MDLIDASAPQPPMGGGEWRGFISRKSAGERVPFKAIFPANWDGRVVLWVHPEGCASIAPDDAGIKSILGSSAAVLAIEPFMSGTFLTTKKAVTKPPSTAPAYAAFTIGYNRTILAERVHDLLSAIAFAKQWKGTRSISIAGVGAAGPTALLARAMADGWIDRAACELNGFDFPNVTADSDPMLLPGAMKYGGLCGFATLCRQGLTMVYGAAWTGIGPSRPVGIVPAGDSAVIVKPQPGDGVSLVGWLMLRETSSQDSSR